MGVIASYQENIEKKVDKAITAVELQYNALASVTFTYLGRYTNVLALKSQHDKLSYGAYSKARQVNKAIGDQASVFIARVERPETPQSKFKNAASKAIQSASGSVSSAAESARASIEKLVG